MTWDITNNDYDAWHIKFNNGLIQYYVPKGRIYMTVTEPYLYLYWTNTEQGDNRLSELLVIDYNDVSSLPASVAALKVLIDGYNVSGISGSGDVVGPAGAVDERIAVFDGITGKLIKDGGYTIADIIALAGGGYVVIDLTFADDPYTVIPTSGQTIYNVDTTGGTVNIAFPTAVGNTAAYTVHNRGANSVILNPDGAETINGNATQTLLFLNTSVDIYSDNANLFIR